MFFTDEYRTLRALFIFTVALINMAIFGLSSLVFAVLAWTTPLTWLPFVITAVPTVVSMLLAVERFGAILEEKS